MAVPSPGPNSAVPVEASTYKTRYYKAEVCNNHVTGVLPGNKQLAGTVSGSNTNLALPAQEEITFKAQNISLHHSEVYFLLKVGQGSLKSNINLEEDSI